MVDATIGGGTVDKHEAELFGPGLEPFMYFDHTREDTDPFNWCCDSGDAVNSWLCQLCKFGINTICWAQFVLIQSIVAGWRHDDGRGQPSGDPHGASPAD